MRAAFRFKRLFPTSLWGRSLLIIVLPVVLMQVAVTWVFFDAHWNTVTARLSDALAGDVAWAIETYADDPRPQTLARVSDRAERTLGLSIVLQPGRTLPVERRPNPLAALDRSLQRALANRLDDPFWFDTTRYPNHVDIRVQTAGGVVRVIAPRDRAFAASGQVFVLWLSLATLLLGAVAVAFIRNQVKSIERLSAAAEAFGRGDESVQLKPHGAREVRAAAHAFLDMRERIVRQVEQRTALLASVSHDLRTPLTRLQLELALARKTPRTEAMKRDLLEMEHMIDEYLAFARGQGGEAVERVRLRPVLEAVSDTARKAGAEVRVSADPDLHASVRPNAFKRAVSNLVMNAAAHGERVELAARLRPSGDVEVTVDDDGPGLSPDAYEEAFKPFNRLDPSRNQNVKGVGLGLAIARDVARGHGGDVTLTRSALGGLRAVVRLPA